MSLIAIPFAVDIGKVKAIFGSKDKQLLEAIKTANLYEHYANQSDDFIEPEYVYNFDEALEDIIFRYIQPSDRKVKRSLFGFIKTKPEDTGLNKRIAHGYGYVLLVVCDYFGTHLLPACDGFYYGHNFKEAFEIPEHNDFPAIKHFTKPEIEHICAVMEKITIDENKANFDSDDYDEVQEMLKDIKESFLLCQQNNLD